MDSPTSLEKVAFLELVKRGNGQVRITNRPPSIMSRTIKIGRLLEEKGLLVLVVHEEGRAINAVTVELTPKGRERCDMR